MKLVPTFEGYGPPPSYPVPSRLDNASVGTPIAQQRYSLGVLVLEIPAPRFSLQAALILIDYILDHTSPSINDETLAYLARKHGFVPPRSNLDRSGLYILRKTYHNKFEDLYLEAQKCLLGKILDTFTYHEGKVPPVYGSSSFRSRPLSPSTVRALQELHAHLTLHPSKQNWNVIDGALTGTHLTLKLDLKGIMENTVPNNLVNRSVTNAPLTTFNPECFQKFYCVAKNELCMLTSRSNEYINTLRRIAQLTKIAVEVMQLQNYDDTTEDSYSTVNMLKSFDSCSQWMETGVITCCRRFAAYDPETALVIEDLSYPLKTFNPAPKVMEQYNPTIRLLIANYVVQTCYTTCVAQPHT
jgi:hypothetical protein